MNTELTQETYSKQAFTHWILSHENEEYQIIQDDDNTLRLKTEFGEATIRFTEIEAQMIIVEFIIVANKDDSTQFYLHFQLSDEKHAKKLYDEMVQTLLQLKDKKTVKVLLSCSAGLTTSMFASELNSTSEMLKLDLQFDAVPYTDIYKQAENYDIILIAPQIGYLKKRLAESLDDKLVLQIPTALFASYDSFSVIKFVQDEIQQFYAKKEEKKKRACACKIKEKKRILAIVIMPNRAQSRIYYELYENGQIVDQNLIIKPSTNYEDLNDIIDTILIKYQTIDMIGISTSGIIGPDGIVHMRLANVDNINLKERIEDKYKIQTYVFNNANAAVLGFAQEHKDCQNIIFHSQPFGYSLGGQGILSNGQLVFGKNGIAGEVRFFMNRMQLSDELINLCWSTQGVLEIVTKSLLPAIALFGPEIVAIRSPMTSDMDEIKKKLLSFIPEEYMPEFIYVKDASGYMLDGTVRLCLDLADKEKKVQV